MLPDKLLALASPVPTVGLLKQHGELVGRRPPGRGWQVSEPRPACGRGHMDTGLCEAAFELADRADMLVCESTFADAEATLAPNYGT